MRIPVSRGIVIGVFVLLVFLLLPTRLRVPASETFIDDAGEYNTVALHVLETGKYSLDGQTPYVKREPGQSMFIAAVYAVFGKEMRGAFFLIQALLLLGSALFFIEPLERRFSPRVATLFLGLLLLFPATLHIVFSFYREALALSLFLLLTGSYLRFEDTKQLRFAVLTGVVFGCLILTYATFLLLPIPLLVLMLYRRLPWLHIAASVAMMVVVVSLWGIRNMSAVGKPCLTGCARSPVLWYIRGEQAEHVHGLEPFLCLWSEYVSRDWTGRSPYCSFNSIMHQRWPNGIDMSEDTLQAGKEGQRKILRYFGSYIWFSVVDILELHLPYVNGWGKVYNMLAAIASMGVYAGIVLALSKLWHEWRKVLVFLLVMAYSTGIYVLTDATPRYLMPVIFCYALCAAIGYDRILLRQKHD